MDSYNFEFEEFPVPKTYAWRFMVFILLLVSQGNHWKWENNSRPGALLIVGKGFWLISLAEELRKPRLFDTRQVSTLRL